jgi:hypothetical protein
MDKKSDRKELERRLAQARRMAAEPNDPLTKERLKKTGPRAGRAASQTVVRPPLIEIILFGFVSVFRGFRR